MRVCVTILLRVSVLVCVCAHGSPVRTVPSVSIRRVWVATRVWWPQHAQEIYTQTAHFSQFCFDFFQTIRRDYVHRDYYLLLPGSSLYLHFNFYACVFY